MHAAACTPSDLNILFGKSILHNPPPFIGGSEGVGKVAAVGKRVSSLKVGDTVVPIWSTSWQGTWRSTARLLESELVRVPENMPQEVAAHASVSVATALRILTDYVPLVNSDHVVLTGASSAVEQTIFCILFYLQKALLQLASRRGLNIVCVVKDDAERGFAQELGAWKAVNLQEFKALRMNNAALVADGTGGKMGATVARSLKLRGCFLSYGDSSQQGISLPIGGLIFNDTYCRGFSMNRWVREQPENEVCTMVKEALSEAQGLRLLGSQHFPVSEVERAVKAAGGESVAGGVVVLDC
ncbi:unnamed protein product [Choristocarpus tenellus]